jgi:hypothetical protein
MICGNDPNIHITPEDQIEIKAFQAWLELSKTGVPITLDAAWVAYALGAMSGADLLATIHGLKKETTQ